MQLQFEHTQKVVNGVNPAIYHSPDNVVQVMFLDDERRIRVAQAETPLGNFADLTFTGSSFAAPDAAVANLKIAYLPRINVWAVWLKAEVTHRRAILLLKQDANKYLVDGSISLKDDDPTVTLSLTLENPAGIIASEDITEVPPGTRIAIYFRAGDSARMSLGSYYIDRITTKTGDPQVSISARNIVGKLLKDQTVDGSHRFGTATVTQTLEKILENARIELHRVENTQQQIGIEFPCNMTYYDSIQSILSVVDGWSIKEDVNGAIVIGGPTYIQNYCPAGIYSFQRDSDCFSREVTRDDREVYSRVGVHDRDFFICAWRDVVFQTGWNMPTNKTLYVEVPEGTPLAQAATKAATLAARLAKVGVIESFTAPIRPHIQPGDQADIYQDGLPRTLGVITQVDHHFGRSGFTTDFTVDSGGMIKKPSIKALIEDISGRKDVGQAKILE